MRWRCFDELWLALVGDTPHGGAEALIVVVGRVEIATAEVQVVRVVATAGSTRPIVTVGACIVERAVIGVNAAGSREGDAINR